MTAAVDRPRHWLDGLGFRGQSEAFFRRYADVATAWEACPKATWALALAYRLGLDAGAPEFRAIASDVASAAGIEAAPGGEWGAWGSAYDTCIRAARASESFDDSIAASTDVVRRHIPAVVIVEALSRIGAAR